MNKFEMLNQDVLKLICATADTVAISKCATESPDALRQVQITVRAVLLIVEFNNPKLDPDTEKRLRELKDFANQVI